MEMKGLIATAYFLLSCLITTPLLISIPTSVQMIGQASLIIFIASFNAAERERKRKIDGESSDTRDVIKSEQAYRFPLVASVALFSMFLAFKYLPKEWVSFLLTMYGVFFGAVALQQVIAMTIESVISIPDALKKEYGIKDVFTLSALDVFAFIGALPVAYWYYKTKGWLPNNVLACSLALTAVDALALGDFMTGMILLSGLFFYDIFWVFGSKSVFGSNVMVSVAKQFEGPIKLVFPKFVGAGAGDMSMLGLGDIVIPGLFVALMMRFDMRKSPLSQPTPSSLPYFWSSMVAYILGLIATVLAMNIFKAAQPALLYLVPSCLITALGAAGMNGELRELLSYSEEDKEKKQGMKEKSEKEGISEKPLEEKKEE